MTAGEDTMDARREGKLGGRVRVVVVVPRCHGCERGSGSGVESLSTREWR